VYIVTGGAGFIGSNLVAELAARGEAVVVCDWLRSDERWRNLAKHEIVDLIAPEDLLFWLETNQSEVEAVVHLGAISSTTETDVDLIVRNNVRATLDLVQWCTDAGKRLIYASSAATYGDGSAGFDDGEALSRLRPLNAYGWSKHFVDRRVARLAAQGSPLPPQWVGLKFFNVYGPNEYHKGRMISVVKVKYDEVAAGGAARLFRSTTPGLADGEQRRDFIWIGDVVDVLLWLLDSPDVTGLFNLGSGRARTYVDLANAVCDAAGVARQIEFIDMPDALRGQYQSFTEASVTRLRAAGYAGQFTPLEEGVRRYVQDYLKQSDPFV